MERDPTTRATNLARVLITIPTLVYGFVPPIVDIGLTHIFHPSWTPHARFHMLWLVATNTSLAVAALCLLWVGTRDYFRLKMAGLLGLCALGGFFVAVGTLPFYPGALSDKNGVPDIFGIDANLLTFTPALICLLVGLFFGFRARTQTG